MVYARATGTTEPKEHLVAKAAAPPAKERVHDTSVLVRVHRETHVKLAAIASAEKRPRNMQLDVIVEDYYARNGYATK